jgi:hypothetical protein
MHVVVQARGFWTTVSARTINYTEDHMVMEVISKAVPVEMMGSIVSKPTVKTVCRSYSAMLGSTGYARPRQVHCDRTISEMRCPSFKI